MPIKNIVFNLIIHIQLLLSASTATTTSEDKHLNPYKNYDDKSEQFGLTCIKSEIDNILASPQRVSFTEFSKRKTLVPLREAFNSKYNLSSKLAGKILYFLTNAYAPHKRAIPDLQQPFIIIPQKIDISNLSPYSSESLSVTVKLREGISKAEVIDIIPSSDQILILFCSKNSLIKKPSCSQTIYDTDDKNISIVINYKIIPKKIGLSHFRLYLLCKINDSYYTVVTIIGQYLVNRPVPFSLHFYNPHFLIRYGKTYYNYLWIKNNGNSNSLITDIIGFGNQLGLNYPPNFKKKHFSQQPIPQEIRKRIEEGEPTYWNIPPKEERPVIEMFFIALPKTENLPENVGFTSNKTGVTYINADLLVQTLNNSMNEGQYQDKSESHVYKNDKNIESHSNATQVEPEWPNLEFNIFKLVIDSKMYYLNLLTYFNYDMKFWEHEFINFGVFCTRMVRHEVSVYVSNRLEKAAVLYDISVEQNNRDFQIEIASFYKHSIILPFADEKFMLLKLIVHYKGNQDFAILKANLIAKLDLASERYIERLPIHASYAANLLELNEKGNFVVDSTTKNFDIQIRQNAAAEIIVNKIELHESSDNDKFYTHENVWERNSTTNKHTFTIKEFRNIFNFKFNFTKDDTFTKFKNRFAVVVYSMENIFTLGLNFFYKMPLCSKGKNSKVLFRCDKSPTLNFGIFSNASQIKTRTIKLWNKLPSELFIKRMEILMTHPSFALTLNMTHYFNGDKVQNNAIYSNNDTLKENINLLLLKEEMCNIDLSIMLTKNEYAQSMGMHFIFPIRFIMSDGQIFLINANFQFVQGKISYKPHLVNVNMIYPGPVLSKSFKITSTYAEELSFEDTMITGPSKDMIHIYRMDRSFEDNLNDMEIRFSIDPSFILRQTSFYSQTNQTDDSLCLWDLERYNNTHMVWQKLVKEGLNNFNAVVNVVTNLKKNIKIAVRGKISYPEISKIPLALENNIAGTPNYHSVVIRNVFKKKLRFKMYLAPQSFMNMDSIDDEIISLIEKQARAEGQNIICIEHNQISSENIKFFTRKLYLENLQFINHPKPHLSSVNHACFKFPDTAVDREKFFLNFKSTTNFFFKFSQYNDKQDKSELLSKHLIVIDDIRKYTDYDAPQIEKATNTDPNGLTLWSYFVECINSIFSLKSVILAFFYRPQTKPIEKQNVILLNHVKTLNDHLAKKNVYLNPLYKEKVFIVPPLSSITIKDALVVMTNPDNNFSNIPVNLLIKNNITALYKIPLVLKKANVKLEQTNSELQSSPNPFGNEKVLHLSVTTNNFQRKILKNNKTLLFYKRPIIKTIEIKNNGTSSIKITKATFANGKRRSSCLELFEVRPKNLHPGSVIKLKLLIFFCRKTNAYYNEQIMLYSRAQVFEFKLAIKLDGFYVGSNEKSMLYTIFWYLQNLVYSMCVLRFAWYSIRKKRSVSIEISPKKINAVFIPETLLKEKLLVYNCRLNPVDFELTGRLSPLPAWLKTEKEVQKIKSVNNLDQDPNNKNEILGNIKKLDKKKKNLNKILKEKHHYSTINPNNPVENSYMSVEQICQMLDPEKSSSEDKNSRRKKLISQAEFSKDEINPQITENRFGSIGDRLGGKEEVSNSSFQTDQFNDISHSKVNRGSNPANRINPETLVYSFINNKQLEEDDYDVQENSEDFEQELKEHEKLGQLFDIAPLTTGKSKTHFNFYSQKLVTFKMDDNDNDVKPEDDRKRTNTDAKTLFRKNSEQSNSDYYQTIQKSQTETLSKKR